MGNIAKTYLRNEDDLVKLVEDLRDGVVYLTNFTRRYTEGGSGSGWIENDAFTLVYLFDLLSQVSEGPRPRFKNEATDN